MVLSVQKATPFLYILPYHVDVHTARLNVTVYVHALFMVKLTFFVYVALDILTVDHNAQSVNVVHATGTGQ